MTRDDARDLLIDLIDGTLSVETAAAVQAQVAADPELREELEALREAEAAVKALPKVKAPADFLSKLTVGLDAVDAEIGRRAGGSFRHEVGAGLTAAPPAPAPLAAPVAAPAAKSHGGNGSRPASANVIRPARFRAPPRPFAMAAMLLVGIGIGVTTMTMLSGRSAREVAFGGGARAPASAATVSGSRAAAADDIRVLPIEEKGLAAFKESIDAEKNKDASVRGGAAADALKAESADTEMLPEGRIRLGAPSPQPEQGMFSKAKEGERAAPAPPPPAPEVARKGRWSDAGETAPPPNAPAPAAAGAAPAPAAAKAPLTHEDGRGLMLPPKLGPAGDDGKLEKAAGAKADAAAIDAQATADEGKNLEGAKSEADDKKVADRFAGEGPERSRSAGETAAAQAAQAAAFAAVEAQDMREEELLATLALAQEAQRQRAEARRSHEDAVPGAGSDDPLDGARASKGGLLASGEDSPRDKTDVARGKAGDAPAGSAQRVDGSDGGGAAGQTARGPAGARTAQTPAPAPAQSQAQSEQTAAPPAAASQTAQAPGAASSEARFGNVDLGDLQDRSRVQANVALLAQAPQATVFRLTSNDAADARAKIFQVCAANGVRNYAWVAREEIDRSKAELSLVSATASGRTVEYDMPIGAATETGQTAAAPETAQKKRAEAPPAAPAEPSPSQSSLAAQGTLEVPPATISLVSGAVIVLEAEAGQSYRVLDGVGRLGRVELRRDDGAVPAVTHALENRVRERYRNRVERRDSSDPEEVEIANARSKQAQAAAEEAANREVRRQLAEGGRAWRGEAGVAGGAAPAGKPAGAEAPASGGEAAGAAPGGGAGPGAGQALGRAPADPQRQAEAQAQAQAQTPASNRASNQAVNQAGQSGVTVGGVTMTAAPSQRENRATLSGNAGNREDAQEGLFQNQQRPPAAQNEAAAHKVILVIEVHPEPTADASLERAAQEKPAANRAPR